ncbi:hypothetical protein SLEP1_g33816 [Rubroshorea leprosula]|uniref:Uncharacterized protein n=1 Tax=Rubroshorea leprosula TaxID=152421 RepID=A0AAV5KHS6_9ROSI|nr:hypothetical protein SLEP1_g33816 [Rubroshorea leprosula]
MISFKSYAFMGPFHECTTSALSSNLVLGCDRVLNAGF